jgi:hypothetical protein
MSRLDRVSERLVGAYTSGSLSETMRQKRWQMFADTFPDISEMSVLDLGGDARAWRLSGVRPAHVTLLNTGPQVVDEPWMSAVVGDACALDSDLPTADLVYSNSVIEHVGGHWRRQRFAESVRRVSSRFWVQTPNRYFPVEPHFLFPGLQHLPRRLAARSIAAWPFGNFSHIKTSEHALRAVMAVELLSESELRAYFPEARIERERFAGLTKSLIAVSGD